MRAMEFLFVLLVCVVASGTATTTKKNIYHFPPEGLNEMQEGFVKCVSKLKFDPSVVNLLIEGKYAEDDRVVEAMLCMMEDMGIGTAAGRPIVDKVMSVLFPSNPEIRAVIETCDRDYGKPPVPNLKIFLLCFRDTAPLKVAFD